eukprot:11943304-Heterocapsa_arctica.AAC.1
MGLSSPCVLVRVELTDVVDDADDHLLVQQPGCCHPGHQEALGASRRIRVLRERQGSQEPGADRLGLVDQDESGFGVLEPVVVLQLGE